MILPKKAAILCSLLIVWTASVSAKGSNKHKEKNRIKKGKAISVVQTDEKPQKNAKKKGNDSTNDGEDGSKKKANDKTKDGSNKAIGTLKSDKMFSNLSTMLVMLYEEFFPGSVAPLTSFSQLYTWADILHVTGDGHVPVDIVAASNSSVIKNIIENDLIPLGFRHAATYGRFASGTLPVSALNQLSNIPNLMRVAPVLLRTTTGSVTSEGVAVMRADDVQEKFGLKGKGVTVGALSDSFNALGTAANDIATGDLPGTNDLNILKDDLSAGKTDEGRALMQIIYDVAPKAKLAFHTASGGIAVFAEGIEKLAFEAKCDVIVDDVSYPTEPFFQDGPLAQAVDKVRSKNVAYFSSAGNIRRQSYEAPFVDSKQQGEAGILHNFDSGLSDKRIDTFQQIYLGRGVSFIQFQWDEPHFSVSGAPGSASDLDIFVFLCDGPLTPIAFGVDANVGNDPSEVVPVNVDAILDDLGTPNANGLCLRLSIELVSGPQPGLMKIILEDGSGKSSFVGYPTCSGTLVGHANAAGGSAVGAAYYGATKDFGVNPPVIENFSSAGGTPILFDKAGNRLGEPKIRNQPRMVGPDGVTTTFFPTEGSPFFFGTSAAAPHVAGVAALMIEGKPGITPKEIIDAIEKTARDMDDPLTPGFDKGFDYATGWGLTNAKAAVEFIGVESKSDVEENGEQDRALVENGLRGGKFETLR